MRQLSVAELLVVLGVAVLLWLGRTLLPEMQSPVRLHPQPPRRSAKHTFSLPRRPLFWVLVGLFALLAVALATRQR